MADMMGMAGAPAPAAQGGDMGGAADTAQKGGGDEVYTVTISADGKISVDTPDGQNMPMASVDDLTAFFQGEVGSGESAEPAEENPMSAGMPAGGLGKKAPAGPMADYFNK
jgi:hypothetical protein